MQYQIAVENIKCQGCARSILSKLAGLSGVSEVSVDVAQGTVSFQTSAELLASVKQILAEMGYPEQGSLEGLSSVGAKAKSYVSCAIGKLSKE